MARHPAGLPYQRQSNVPALLVACTLMMASTMTASTAAADTRWFQLPAHAAWVDVTAPWKLAADDVRPLLWGTHPGGARLWIVAQKGNEQAAVVAQLRTLVDAAYPAVKWQGNGKTALEGRVRLDNARLPVTVGSRFIDGPKGGISVAVALVRPTRAPADVKGLGGRVLASLRHQWERPRGGNFTVVGANVVVTEPEKLWVANSTRAGRVVRLVRDGGGAELRFSFEAQDTTAAGALDRLARGLDPGGTAWTADEAWEHRAFEKPGAARRGTVTITESDKRWTYTTRLWAVPLERGVLVVVGSTRTPEGATMTEIQQEMRAILETLTLRPAP